MDNKKKDAAAEELHQIPKPISVGAGTNSTRITRGCCKDSKTLLIVVIVAIILLLSATCVCTIYTLSALKSEIASRNLASSNTASLQLKDNSSASLDFLDQKIISVQQTLNTSTSIHGNRGN